MHLLLTNLRISFSSSRVTSFRWGWFAKTLSAMRRTLNTSSCITLLSMARALCLHINYYLKCTKQVIADMWVLYLTWDLYCVTDRYCLLVDMFLCCGCHSRLKGLTVDALKACYQDFPVNIQISLFMLTFQLAITNHTSSFPHTVTQSFDTSTSQYILPLQILNNSVHLIYSIK